MPGFERFHLTKELFTLGLAIPVLLSLRMFRVDALDAGVASLLALVAVSAIAAINPMLALRGLAIVAVGALCFITSRGLELPQRNRVQDVLLFGAFVIAALALAEAMGVWRGVSIPGHAPGATVGQRNNVAHLLTLATPVALQRLSNTNRRSERIAFGALLALFAIVVVVSRCRAAWVVFPIVTAVVMVKGRLHTRVAAPLMLGLVIALMLPVRLSWRSANPYADTASRLFDVNSGSGQGRLIQAAASLTLVAKHPVFGVGPQHWKLYYPTVRPADDPTSAAEAMTPNGRLLLFEPLALAVEWGMPALLLLIAVVVAMFRRAATNPILSGTLVAIGLLGCFDAILQLPATMVFAASSLGLQLPRPATHVLPLPIRILAAFAIVPALLMLALEWEGLRRLEHSTMGTMLSAGGLAPFDYEVQASLGDALARSGRCAEAETYLLRAMAAAPFFPYAASLRCGASPEMSR